MLAHSTQQTISYKKIYTTAVQWRGGICNLFGAAYTNITKYYRTSEYLKTAIKAQLSKNIAKTHHNNYSTSSRNRLIKRHKPQSI